MEKSIKNSTLLKALCYVLIPIFIVILIFCFIYTVYISENEDVLEREKVEQTENFANEYMSAIGRIYRLLRWEQTNFSKYTENIYIADTYSNTSELILYTAVDTRTGITYTNMKDVYSLEDFKQKLEANDGTLYYHFNPETQKVSTNIDNVQIQQLMDSYMDTYIEKYKYYDIYTTINEVNSFNNDFFVQKMMFDIAKKWETLPIIGIPILIFFIIIMSIYLTSAIGHKKNHSEIYLTSFDKIPIELLILGAVTLMAIPTILGMFEFGYSLTKDVIMLTTVITVVLWEYSILAIIGTTIVKKIKSHTLIRSSLIYQILHWLLTNIYKIKNTILSHVPINIKIVLTFIGTIAISIILVQVKKIGVILLIVLWVFEIWFIIKQAQDFMKIKETLEKIYNGKIDNKLDENEFRGDLRIVSKYVNDIQSGFSNAIEESLKSERMKTELITNVSHDIKTPLTSIINYVDLLKAEEINNDKAKEYIEVLDTKSQRLKKLIEDLVEASKASSGNIKLNIERIDLVELIKQTTGEFEDKFKQRNLIVDMISSNDNICIEADNRYMYRVIENVFSNISKYALENSRVYIDISENNGKARITIKNISKEKLNITTDELMQRFVRGDKSRTTEGSGLGLSISKSLVELQGGRFDILIDGDLFKVLIEF